MAAHPSLSITAGATELCGRMAWSRDGRLLVAPYRGGVFLIWPKSSRPAVALEGISSKPIATAIDPDNATVATSHDDGAVHIWDCITGKPLRTLFRHPSEVRVYELAWAPDASRLAAACGDGSVRIWSRESYDGDGRDVALVRVPGVDVQLTVAWARDSRHLAFASYDIWEVDLWTGVTTKLPVESRGIYQVAWSQRGEDMIAIACADATAKVWNVSRRETTTLEGPGGHMRSVSFSSDGRLLAAGSDTDHHIRVWDTYTWAIHSVVDHRSSYGVAFHPRSTILATANLTSTIDLFDLTEVSSEPAVETLVYKTAKVILVGDSGVGKTGLGWRLAHGTFKEHASTHGQQFWSLDALRESHSDGAYCEVILWDFAGQADYRLIHALFADDADVALLLFDPTHSSDPFHGVDFWLSQLRSSTPNGVTPVLVGARSDRGAPTVTADHIREFCNSRGIAAYVETSALEDRGTVELLEIVRRLIPWKRKPAAVTTADFQRAKELILDIKSARSTSEIVVTPESMRELMAQHGLQARTGHELDAVLLHLENHGFLKRIATSAGHARVLLAPELLNNLAASFVVEARRNERGLGALHEQALLAGQYSFPELDGLDREHKSALIDAVTVLFIEHNVAFRQSDPFSGQSYVVFPGLINVRKPLRADDISLSPSTAYTVTGAVKNVHASLVVLLGYTPLLTRTEQWNDEARYRIGDDAICAFKTEAERDDSLDLVLSYGANVAAHTRQLFQGLFESLLVRPDLRVTRYDPAFCANGHELNRAILRSCVDAGRARVFCNDCGAEISLPVVQALRDSGVDTKMVREQRLAAQQRTAFEEVLFKLCSYLVTKQSPEPTCFISYAWGNEAEERWVEDTLASDLQKVSVRVILDRWDNKVGSSVSRFVERVSAADRVIVVGTPAYRRKYDNAEPMRGFVVAAEGDLIGKRMLGTEPSKESVLTVLLDGNEESAFPPILQGRVYADFRITARYFEQFFDLVLAVHRLPSGDPRFREWRKDLSRRPFGVL